MGIEHGAFCAGCCWFLMALLFYGGIMNLYWIVGLALYVLLEKTIPAGHWLGRIAGVAADRLGRRAHAGGGPLKPGPHGSFEDCGFASILPARSRTPNTVRRRRS